VPLCDVNVDADPQILKYTPTFKADQLIEFHAYTYKEKTQVKPKKLCLAFISISHPRQLF